MPGVPGFGELFYAALGEQLTEFAERSFELDRDEEGRTRRDRLTSRLERAIRKNRPDVAAELEAELWCPPFPVALNYVWRAWVRLRRRIGAGMNGPQPITWADIDAFVRRTGIRLDPRDIELIEALDDLYLVKTAEQASERDKQQALRDGLERVSKQGVRRIADG